MKEYKLTILGRIPSKKNSRNIFVLNGRICNTPNSKYQKWHKEVSREFPSLEIEGSCDIEIKIYFPDLRRADLTNKAESIMDLLVDNKIIEDDNHEIVKKIHIESMGIDRFNPRAEVTIWV